MDHYYGGLSGIKLPYPRYRYPQHFQQVSRLRYYSTLFNSIEVNSSFYKIPQPTTVTRWKNEVPDGFRFTFKLFKGITHVQNLNYDKILVDDFISGISCVANKLGCVLIQLPPSITSSAVENLHSLLLLLSIHEITSTWRIAVEFRNADWYQDDVFDLLTRHKCALVLHDKKTSAPPFEKALASPFLYWRFHGPTGNYAGSYSESFLHECANYILQFTQEGKEVFVYYNNTKGDDAYNNLIALNRIIRERVSP